MLKSYSVYCAAAKAFMTPFFVAHEEQAIRAMECEVMNPKSNISLYPEDYALYEIGTFNDATGELSELSTIKKVATAFRIKVELEARKTLYQQEMELALENGKQKMEQCNCKSQCESCTGSCSESSKETGTSTVSEKK